MSVGPVFVVGMPRSGTTLLASILDGSPDLAMSPETDYFPNFWRPCQRRGCLETPDGRRRFVARWLGSPEAARLQLSSTALDELRGALAAHPVDHRQILAATLERYAAERGKPAWGEKTPDHVLYLENIQRLFPESKVVQIIRDPRDVGRSLERVPWHRGNLVHHVEKWRRCVLATPGDPARYRRIRYEDLLSDPERVIQNLARFLGIRYDPAMLHPERGRERVFDARDEPWKRKARRPLDPANAGKWRQAMSDPDRGLVSALAGSELQELGYDLDAGMRTGRTRVYIWRRRLENWILLLAHYGRRGVARLGRIVQQRMLEP